MSARRWVFRSLVALALGTVALVAVSMPPARTPVPAAGWRPESGGARARGIYHVHTRRSDGTGTVEEVAAAAARAGAEFLILTDHGDGTRSPDPPRYIGPVLVVDAVEISTRTGHYVALGLGRPTPYRLGGAAGDVVEDVRRLGAFGIVAHPDSSKRSLSWRDWTPSAPAFEWMNADSEWRDESRWSLLRTALTYPIRPSESIAAIFDRPERSRARWDAFARDGRFLVTLAGADAHARLGMRDYEELGPEAYALRLPQYERVFKAFSNVVELYRPFTGEAAADAAVLISSIAGGRVATVIDGIATPGRFEFFAREGDRLVRMGERLTAGAIVEFVARVVAPPGTRLVLLRNGETVAESSGLELTHRTTAALGPGEQGASFRLEARVARALGTPPVPWLVTNAIFVEQAPAAVPALSPTQGQEDEDVGDMPEPEDEDLPGTPGQDGGLAGQQRVGIDLRDCRIEKDAISTGEVVSTEDGDHLSWSWSLAGATEPAWVAIACSTPRPLEARDGLEFVASADEPMRLSVQVRGQGDNRWERSVYVDREPRWVTVPVSALRGVVATLSDVSAEGRHVLFVIDWTNGAPGMRRTVQVGRAAIVRPAPDQVRTVSSR